MIGRPKFNCDDKVSFEMNGKTYIGEVVVVDAYGTFFVDDEACYDVMVEGLGWVKHIREHLLTKVS